MKVIEQRDLEGNFIDVLSGKDKLTCNANVGCATMIAPFPFAAPLCFTA